MALREILVYPDARLRRTADAVETVNDSTRQLIDDMAETMYAAPGIGLAAIQINEPLRVVVIDISEDSDELQVFINPRITETDGGQQIDEGCLSVPGFYATVDRAENITVEALDRFGESFELKATGLLAVCIQHEIDHLDGKVFVDHLSRLKRERVRRKFEKEARRRDADRESSVA